MNKGQYNNKSVLIIGANGGLGLETTKHLVNDGFGRIVMACRTETKAKKAKEEVLASTKTKNPNIEIAFGFDMNNPDKIAKAVQSLSQRGQFDMVFLGAGGVFFTDDYQTLTWNNTTIEKTVFQNLIGSHIVLSHLKRENLLVPNARVVIAGGEGARGIPGMIAKPDFKDAADFKSYVLADFSQQAKYNPMNAIGVSKFSSALWCKKIAQLEKDNMTVIWFSPGLTYGTAGLSSLSPIKQWFMQKIGFGIARLFGLAQSPKDGGRKFANCIEGKIGNHGDVLGAPNKKTIGKITDQTTMNAALNDQTYYDVLWDILEQVDGPFGQKTKKITAF